MGRTCHTVPVHIMYIAVIATPKKRLTKILLCNLFNGRKQLNPLASPGLKYMLSFKHIVEYFPKSGSWFPMLCFFNLNVIYNTLNSFLTSYADLWVGLHFVLLSRNPLHHEICSSYFLQPRERKTLINIIWQPFHKSFEHISGKEKENKYEATAACWGRCWFHEGVSGTRG